MMPPDARDRHHAARADTRTSARADTRTSARAQWLARHARKLASGAARAGGTLATFWPDALTGRPASPASATTSPRGPAKPSAKAGPATSKHSRSASPAPTTSSPNGLTRTQPVSLASGAQSTGSYARACAVDPAGAMVQSPNIRGRTCECSLAPACLRHDRAKQAPGKHLEQAEPGQMTWRLPSGRV
jgi:hypothetical protein